MSLIADLTAPDPAAPPRIRLFQAKLQPPRLLAHAVSRLHVIEPLLASLPGGLVVVTAPAGFGKTTLLAQIHDWMRGAGLPTGWLSLEHSDDDLGRFAAYLRAALNHALGGEGESAGGAAVASVESPLSDAMELIEIVAASDQPFALFLDDFHEIRNPEILAFVPRLLAALGPEQRLLIAGREQLPLDIRRLHAYGRAVELDARRLRFSLEESREFLRQGQLGHLAEADVQFLHQRTEGWAAAMQLAALALAAGHERPQALLDTALSVEDVAGHLVHEVFAQQPADIQAFLLRISILPTFCAELCDAVRGTTDSRDLIRRIERANLFLTPLDGRRHWFRFHQMFVEFLRQQLAARGDIAVNELHCRAARWLATDDRDGRAVEHALLGEDRELAADLMNGCAAELLAAGRAAKLVQWAGMLPVELIVRRAELHGAATLSLIALHRHEEARRLIDAFERQVGEPEPARGVAALVLRVLLAGWADRFDELGAALQEVAPFEALIDSYRLWTLRNCKAMLTMMEDDLVSARRQFVAAKAALQKIGGRASMVYSDAGIAMCGLLQGEVRDAAGHLEQALEAWEPQGERFCISNATIAAVLAEAKYLTRSITASRELLDIFLPLVKEGGIADMLIVATRVRTRIATMDDEPELARELLSELESLGEQRRLPRVVASAWLEKSRLALLAGNVGAAQRHLEVAADSEVWRTPRGTGIYANDFETPAVAQLRIRIVEGAFEAAIPELQQALAESLRQRRLMRALRLKILLAQALWVGQRNDEALQQMRQALEDASAEHLLQPFVDEPWVLAALVRALARAPGSAAGSPMLDALVTALNIDLAAGPEEPPATAPTGANVEPALLSRREIEVLAMVAGGLSNKVIARKLFRSEATIATHLRHIYAKLEANGRMQAILFARQRGLLA